MKTVFILGAGFSKAVNADMPLLADLSKGVESTLSSKGIDIGPDLEAIEDVEQWLTLLAEPAPWLSPADRMRNMALFTDVSQAIHDVLIAMQVKASVTSPPDWLIPLVEYWHRTEATVVTFNYDCLVELAYLDAMPRAGHFWPADIYAIPITPAVQRAGGIGRQKPVTFNLLKLHGSLDWWYSGPEAEQSDPIYWKGWTGHFGEGMAPLWGEFGPERLVADKLPMIVPPAATKGPFYRNKLLAEQWAMAASAMNEADVLVLMGYSAPVTDLTVTSLIATQFRGDMLVPVNRSRNAVERARSLGSRSSPPQVIDTFVGADAISKWTRKFAS